MALFISVLAGTPMALSGDTDTSSPVFLPGHGSGSAVLGAEAASEGTGDDTDETVFGIPREATPDGAGEMEPNRVSPSGALYRSLVVPGWGQVKNGRRLKAAFFVLAEAVCIGGYLYKNAQYHSGDYTGLEKDALRTDQNTFLLYWILAKVLDITDAYVDAQFSTYDVTDITPQELAR